MQCANHQDKEATRTCSICGTPLSRGCAKKIKGNRENIFACKGLCARKARARLRLEQWAKVEPAEWFFDAMFLTLGLARLIWRQSSAGLDFGVLWTSLGLAGLVIHAFNCTKFNYVYKRSFAALVFFSMALAWLKFHVWGAIYMACLVIAAVVIVVAMEIRDAAILSENNPST